MDPQGAIIRCLYTSNRWEYCSSSPFPSPYWWQPQADKVCTITSMYYLACSLWMSVCINCICIISLLTILAFYWRRLHFSFRVFIHLLHLKSFGKKPPKSCRMIWSCTCQITIYYNILLPSIVMPVHVCVGYQNFNSKWNLVEKETTHYNCWRKENSPH